MADIRIALCEDNDIFRDSLKQFIDETSGFTVIASVSSADKMLDDMGPELPDVILMDIDMPGVNGIEGLKRVRAVNDKVKILMLTVFDDNQNVFQAISNGANGYILKKTPPARLLEYIAEAATGGAPITASLLLFTWSFSYIFLI